MYREFWYCVLALIIVLSYPRRTILRILHTQKRLQAAKHKLYIFFLHILTRTHGLVVKVSSSALGCSDSIPALCWNSLLPLGHLCGTEPVSALTLELFILLRSLWYFFLGFCHGLSCSHTVLLLTWTFNFHCFEHLESGPGLHSPTCAGLAHGQRL